MAACTEADSSHNLRACGGGGGGWRWGGGANGLYTFRRGMYSACIIISLIFSLLLLHF